jgi:hypothetical protein
MTNLAQPSSTGNALKCFALKAVGLCMKHNLSEAVDKENIDLPAIALFV